MNIYVGDISFEVTETDLHRAFEAFGQVTSVKVIKDKDSGASKGFGFVRMPTTAEAYSAINGLNGKALKGKTVKVKKAHPRPEGRLCVTRFGEAQGGNFQSRRRPNMHRPKFNFCMK